MQTAPEMLEAWRDEVRAELIAAEDELNANRATVDAAARELKQVEAAREELQRFALRGLGKSESLATPFHSRLMSAGEAELKAARSARAIALNRQEAFERRVAILQDAIDQIDRSLAGAVRAGPVILPAVERVAPVVDFDIIVPRGISQFTDAGRAAP
ncbi:MAG: hypothetical protein ACRD3Q_02990 [Terriglobales bacterium]